jgi:hypothetical protein
MCALYNELKLLCYSETFKCFMPCIINFCIALLYILSLYMRSVAPPGGRKRRICVYLFLQNVTTVVLIIHRDRVFNVNFGP